MVGLDFVLFIFAIGVGYMIYTIPAWVAYFRYHKNAWPITIVNLLFGWTFIGWVIALVWSTTDNVEQRA